MPPGIKEAVSYRILYFSMALTTCKDEHKEAKRISHAQHGPSPWPRLDSRSDQVSLQGRSLVLPCSFLAGNIPVPWRKSLVGKLCQQMPCEV